MNKLEVDGVRLQFGDKPILSNVYLKCTTGDITGIVGRNGSGKSSLMKVIFGSLVPEDRSVRINEQYLHRPYESSVIHYLPQEGFVPDYVRFDELIRVYNLDPFLEELLEIEEIKIHRASRFGELSGGVRKLMEIVLLLYTPGSFVLLDEPFSFLSPVLVEKSHSSHPRAIEVQGNYFD